MAYTIGHRQAEQRIGETKRSLTITLRIKQNIRQTVVIKINIQQLLIIQLQVTHG